MATVTFALCEFPVPLIVALETVTLVAAPVTATGVEALSDAWICERVSPWKAVVKVVEPSAESVAASSTASCSSRSASTFARDAPAAISELMKASGLMALHDVVPL